jgi:hypothetical protein
MAPERRSMRSVETALELRRFLQQPESRAFLEFYEYWLQKSAGKSMPSRDDLDPLDIPRLLPNVFLIDVVSGSPRRFRFRLVGTRIAELEGEMTNSYLDEFIPDSPGTAMARHYDDAAEGHVYLRRETLGWQTREREHLGYDVLLLPLSPDGETVDMLFGLCVYHHAP